MNRSGISETLTTLGSLAIVVVVLISGLPLCSAAERAESSRPRTGLVLAGGGARGAAHIGVLKVMEELRVPVDCVAGTSMGSIVGGLYSAGYSPDEMVAALSAVDWTSIFRDKPDRRRISFRRKEDDILALLPFEIGIGKNGISGKSGIITAQKVEFLFRTLTLDMAGVEQFDDLQLPYRAVAADLETGEPVELDHGDLARAMRASMSVPGVFTPVEVNGRLLVDGGIARNLPVESVQSMGAERIIAINVGTPPKGVGEQMSTMGVYSQTFAVMGESNVKESLSKLTDKDLLITPSLDDISAADFGKLLEAVAAGEAAAREVEDQLRRFAVSESDFEGFLSRQRVDRAALVPEVVIDEIELEGVPESRAKHLMRRIDTRPGHPLDPRVLLKDFDKISQSGEYESVSYRLADHSGRRRLLMEATEKSWGPGYLQIGFGLESDFRGNSDFGVLANYRRTELNRLGAEWKTVASVGNPAWLLSEFYQPLASRGFVFIAPRVGYERNREDIYLANGDLEVFRIQKLHAGFDVGVQFGNYGEIRAGVEAGTLHADPLTESAANSIEPSQGGGRFRFTLDQIDNVFFPTKGNLTRLNLYLSREGLGADDEYDRIALTSAHAWTKGRNTFVGRLAVGTDFDSGLPFYDQFELGGFMNLTGLERGRLRGNVKGLAALVDYWEVAGLGALGKLYLGGAIEAGNVWKDIHAVDLGDLRYSGSLFFGLDSKLLPVYLGYGHTDTGEDSFFLFIGRAFGRD